MINRGAFEDEAQYQGKAPFDSWMTLTTLVAGGSMTLRSVINSEAAKEDAQAGRSSSTTPATNKFAITGAATPFTQAAGEASAGDVAKRIDMLEMPLRTSEMDEQCYDMIIGCISLKKETGKNIVLKIDKKFSQADNLSGLQVAASLWMPLHFGCRPRQRHQGGAYGDCAARHRLVR